MVDDWDVAVATSLTDDSVAIVFHHLAAKWSIPVILVLDTGTHRFNDLRRSIAGISHRLLAVTLRRLERDGLIRREVTDCAPPHVEYSLTALGARFKNLVEMVVFWAHAHSDAFGASSAQDVRELAPPR
jgi:DNA-binding HxlR family transcriptional regulator